MFIEFSADALKEILLSLFRLHRSKVSVPGDFPVKTHWLDG